MTDKLTRLSALLLSFLMLLSLASCSRGGTVEIVSAELIESADGANVKFVLKNNTGADIDKLKIHDIIIPIKQIGFIDIMR